MKLKIEIAMISVLVILDIYLLVLNFNTNNYNSLKSDQSTPNYLVVEEEIKESTDDLIIPEEPVEEIVYDGLTLNELSDKLNRSLNSTVSNQGYLIASYSLERGVDPYLSTAILLHETGCKWECSYLVKSCNNVGGQKGSGCGSYKSYDTLENGIKGFIDNLYKNYISYGLTTPQTINPKYAEDPNWSANVSKYIENIKAL